VARRRKLQIADAAALPPHTEEDDGILLDAEGWDEDGDLAVEGETRARVDAPPAGGVPEESGISPSKAGQERSSKQHRTGDSARVRVLVAERDPELSLLIERLLHSKGLEVETVGRGLAVLTRVRRRAPELLILDAELPEVHGFTVADKIRSNPRFDHVAIVITSSVHRGWRIAADLESSFRIDGFLSKPFKLNDLWGSVEEILARRRGRVVPSEHRIAGWALHAYREAQRLWREGDIDAAIDSCREGIRIDPVAARLHVMLGTLLLKRRGMGHRATEAFEEALKVDPRSFTAMRSLAVLYQGQGFISKAVDMWERALRHCPDEELAARIRKHLVGLL
jgi:CheY-like chemotaxis protein